MVPRLGSVDRDERTAAKVEQQSKDLRSATGVKPISSLSAVV
jgi:hypothetical protein